jgi:hypothetical protein
MNYSKKLGLPNFSSHQCSVTIQSEISDLSQVTGEVKRLYALTQDAVDREIQEVGWMPADPAYGLVGRDNENGNGSHANAGNNGQQADSGAWACSAKQRELVEKIVRENDLDKRAIESLAQEMFGAGVKALNRLQASGLIDELLERHGGQRRNHNGNGSSSGYRGRYPREQRGASR